MKPWLMTLHLAVCCAAVAPDVVRRVEGSSVVLHPDGRRLVEGDEVVWTVGSDEHHRRVASLYDGAARTDHAQRFAGRLQLDAGSGALNVMDLHLADSGIYRSDVFHGSNVWHSLFHLNVYKAVSQPRLQTNGSSADGRCSSVSVRCTADSDREVVLAWYRGNETLYRTSSPDLSGVLSLSLEIRDQDTDNYSCVASNPVDTKVSDFHAEWRWSCLRGGGSTWCTRTHAAVRLAISAGVAVATVALVVDHLWPRRAPVPLP